MLLCPHVVLAEPMNVFAVTVATYVVAAPTKNVVDVSLVIVEETKQDNNHTICVDYLQLLIHVKPHFEMHEHDLGEWKTLATS